MRYTVTEGGTAEEFEVRAASGGQWRVRQLSSSGGGEELQVVSLNSATGAITVLVGQRPVQLFEQSLVDGAALECSVQGEQSRDRKGGSSTGRRGSGDVLSPMPGRVLRILAKLGDVVDHEQPVIVVEAMKMENQLLAPVAGAISEISVHPGQTVEAGQRLLRIKSES